MDKYIKDVLSGKLLASNKIKLACERHENDLKKVDFPYYFDEGEADKAINADPVTFSKMIQKVTNLKPDVALASVKSRNYGVNYITDDIIQAQQQEADTFYKNKLLPKQIQVKDIVWYPPK